MDFYNYCVLFSVLVTMTTGISIHVQPQEIALTVGEDKSVQFYTTDNLPSAVDIVLMRSDSFDGTPHIFQLDNQTRSAKVVITGLQITSHSILEIEGCNSTKPIGKCPFDNLESAFVTVKVVHSDLLSVAVIVTGWIYFFAWSISFYPQIFLNFSRKSVVGLNFDFLLLNVIGFTCYTIYNVLMYFNTYVQELYQHDHPHRLIPVLLNDVVFATHALLACLITALQCFLYERGNQRISYTCWGLATSFGLVAGVTLFLTGIGIMNLLQYITGLSYIKMASTISKYFPQTVMNYRRKSTTGWSIGNILLDFLGGLMDITQVILQGANTDDWSIFIGNPVKVGLGMVSMMFDIIFMIQHYCLYRNDDEGVILITSEESITNELDQSDINILPEIVRVNDEQHIII
uniref:Cystinosin homolog n=1 Tax=Onchocerca volvulus TaxID=6282 RepID=A0A8R1TKH8_ONCVO